MDTIRIIEADTLADALRSGDVDEFWNVLTVEYFGGELIPGSRWVPLDKVGRESSAKNLDKSARIIVYCSGKACPNSRDAATKLATLGFTNVRLFEGGLEAWAASGRGVEVLRHKSAA